MDGSAICEFQQIYLISKWITCHNLFS
jgi:hypothetical protein